MVRSPSTAILCVVSRMFANIILHNVAFSKTILKADYRNGVVAGNKALCLDFVVDIVSLCFILFIVS